MQNIGILRHMLRKEEPSLSLPAINNKESTLNDARAEWAAVGFLKYMEIAGTGMNSTLIDMIVNMQHMSDRTGLSFDFCLETARDIYRAEMVEEESIVNSRQRVGC